MQLRFSTGNLNAEFKIDLAKLSGLVSRKHKYDINSPSGSLNCLIFIDVIEINLQFIGI